MPSLLSVIQTHFLKCYFLSLQFSLLLLLLNCALKMAAFTHQYQPFHLDSLFMSNCVFKMSDSLAERGDIINNSNPILFPLPQSDYLQHIPSVDSSSSTVVNSPQEIISEPSLSEKTMITLESPSIPVDFEGSDQVIGIQKKISTTISMGKKRKNKDESCMNSTLHQSKQDEKRAKATKKQRKNKLGSLELTEAHKKSCKADKKNHSKVKKDPQNTTDYVHVRARRGQATDSHSLAERVRREKISERLKVLQDLVPGCDKVGSKALMLDEIINYVQSLQLQVEMLSMKLAYVNPMFYGFGLDSDGFLVEPEEKLSILGSQVSSFQEQSNAIISTAFVDNNTSSFSSTKNNIPLLDNSSSVSLSLQQEQRPSDYFTHNQGNEDLLWHMGYQRQRFINQLGATNMCFLE